MRQSRLVTGVAVVTAVAAGGVGGALIGVPALSGAQPFSKIATFFNPPFDDPAAGQAAPITPLALNGLVVRLGQRLGG